jgi:hypothetical protein
MEGVQNRDLLVIRDKIRSLNRIVNFANKHVTDYIFMIGEHFLKENCELKGYFIPVENMHT